MASTKQSNHALPEPSPELEKATMDHSEGKGASSPQPVTETVHHDEGAVIVSTYAGDKEWTAEEERKVTRRVDWKLMPVLCATYGLQYYDKAMLSQAVSSS